MISEHVVQAFKDATAPEGWQGDELLRARLEAVFAAARREIAHEALKAPVDPLERDLLTRASRFMAQCGPCDFGLAEFGCSHPDEDYRPVVADLVTEVERLRKKLRHFEALEEQGWIPKGWVG